MLGEGHPETLNTWGGLGRLQLSEHKFAEAERTPREALGRYEKTGPDSWERFNCQSLLGGSLEGQEKYAEAETLLISGHAGMLKRAAEIQFENRPLLWQAGERIVQLYEKWGKPDKAEEWREMLNKDREALAGLSAASKR